MSCDGILLLDEDLSLSNLDDLQLLGAFNESALVCCYQGSGSVLYLID